MHQAAGERLRPILLTSLPNFFGLIPLRSDTVAPARLVEPMAVSRCFGVL